MRDTDREDLRSEIDHHNKDQLQKQKEGKGHWKGELASQSEQAVCTSPSCRRAGYSGLGLGVDG